MKISSFFQFTQKQKKSQTYTTNSGSVSDPHALQAEPDPAYLLNADPDSKH
jgi:hypothetical protein